MLVKIIFFIIFMQQILFGFEYAVITNAHSDISTASPKQLKDIFMMKKHFLNHIKIIPVNITSSSQIRKAFEREVLHVKRSTLNHYWIKQHFQGIRPPTVQSSVNSIKLFIKNVTGAIGYIPLTKIDSDVKVLYEF